VSGEHIRSADDFHNRLVLFSARVRNSLDSELWRSGDVDVVQQITQSAGGNRCFISKSFDLIGIVEHLVLLGVAPRSVVFIFFTFSLVALFFFLLIVFFLPLVMVIVLWHLLSFLRVFPNRYCDHNLEGVLPEERAKGSRATALAGVAHSLVLPNQWADVQCSSGLCGEYEPSKIWK
jgi:hypothetical protein